MKKGIVAAAGLAVMAVAAGTVLPRVVAPSGPATAAEKPHVARPPVPITAGIVKTTDVPVLLSAIGTVQAYNMVTIKSRVDGQIVRVDFNEGDEVRAGTPLFQIDPRPYQAVLDQALANQEKDRANLTNAQLNLARDAKIVANNLAISQQQYDNDKAAVAVDQATVDSDKAQVETARLNVGYCTIASPINGRLGARLVDIGNLVHASDPTGLVTVAQVRPIFVSFTLPQNDLAEIRTQETKSQLPVDAYAGDNTTPLGQGRLTLVDNSVDQATGTIHLKAAFPNLQERLWPGQFVNLRVVLGIRRNVLTVPAETVQQGPDGDYAYVIKPDDTVMRQPIETAVIQAGIAVINKGLQPGERVVVEGQYRLFDGARVKLDLPRTGASG